MRIFSTQQTSKKNFRRHLKALASRYRTSPSHCQTSLPCAYPCSSVAFLGITHPCLCISARLISFPGHASPFRFTAFPCNAYPTRRVHSHFRCCAALRFAPLSHCKSVRRLAVPCPCSATPCNSIQFHFNASPLDTSPFPCSARPHYTLCLCVSLLNPSLPYLCVATRFSTNPLHSSAVGSYSPPCLCFAMRFHAM